MAMHTYHDDILHNGLQDGCERCEQISHDPIRTLDDDNLRALHDNTEQWMQDKFFPRSQNELRAMRIMEQFVLLEMRLARVSRV